MKNHYPLNPVTGQEDQTITWTNGSPATATQGSYPPYQAVVEPMTEVVNVISASGLVPSDADLGQLNEAIDRKIAAGIASIPPEALPAIPGAGEGLVKDGSGNLALNYPGLTQETVIAGTDLVTFYQGVTEGGLAAGHHRQLPFSTFSAAVLAQQAQSVVTSSYVAYRFFTSSTTFTPDAGCTAIEVVGCWGAGGGGGSGGPGGNEYAGAGGGGGGFVQGAFAILPGQAITIQVGAGGAPQTAGGNSSVGSYCTAYGGLGASGNSPGAGGSGTGGQVVLAGTNGGVGAAPGGGNVFPGGGGQSFNGRGGGSSGSTGPTPGSGGSGGGDDYGASGYTGGNGLVILKQIVG